MTLTCPYCQKPQGLPAAKDAGKTFACPYCQKVYRFTGAGAMPIPQGVAQDPGLPPGIPTVGAVVELRDRRGWGLASGFALFLCGIIAVVAEFLLFGMFAVAFPEWGVRLGELLFVAVAVTVLVGVGGLLAGIVQSLRPR